MTDKLRPGVVKSTVVGLPHSGGGYMQVSPGLFLSSRKRPADSHIAAMDREFGWTWHDADELFEEIDE